jgi:hypothetical protein
MGIAGVDAGDGAATVVFERVEADWREETRLCAT